MSFRHPQLLARRALLGSAACAVIGLPAFAQVSRSSWPARPVTLVAVTPPGGNSDTYLRILSVPLAEQLHTQVIVDNRPGAGGTIAGKLVLDGPPDGYLVMGGSGSSHVLYPLLAEKVPYDARKDFRPVAMIGVGYQMLLVRPDSPFRTVSDILAAARKDPGKLSFASPGTFGIQRMAGELLQQRAGIRLVNVPNVRGSARGDVLGGHVDMMFDTGAEEQVKAGTLRAIAVTSPKRLHSFPDIPTMQEQGVADFDVSSWAGTFVHAQTPDAIVDRLNKAIVASLNADPARSRLMALGLEPSTMSAQQFAAFYEQDYRQWAGVVESQGLKRQAR